MCARVGAHVCAQLNKLVLHKDFSLLNVYVPNGAEIWRKQSHWFCGFCGFVLRHLVTVRQAVAGEGGSGSEDATRRGWVAGSL